MYVICETNYIFKYVEFKKCMLDVKLTEFKKCMLYVKLTVYTFRFTYNIYFLNCMLYVKLTVYS